MKPETMALVYGMLDETDTYFDRVYKKGYDNRFVELDYNRARINYEKIQKKLIEIEGKEYNLNLTNDHTLEEFKAIVKELLYSIFTGNFKDDIDTYGYLIKQGEKALVDSDAVTNFVNVEGVFMPSEITVSNRLNAYSIGAATKALTKIMMRPLFNDYKHHIVNIHYEDIIPLLVQYIIMYEYSKDKDVDYLEMYQDNEVIVLSNMLKSSNFLAEILKEAEGYLKERGRQVAECDAHSRYSGVLTEVYCNQLVDIYKENKEELLKYIISFIKGNININDFLDYFNVSLSKKETANKYLSRIQKVTS